MAIAEQLLHEAQFAFHNISFGESRANRRNAAKARSLSMKILRKFPGTMEAREAHALLMRLGDVAFTSALSLRHRHITQEEHHRMPAATISPSARNDMRVRAATGTVDTLDWSGLLAVIFAMPKVLLAVLVVGGFFLFGIFGPLLLLPLLAFVLLTGPFRQMLKPEQRRQMNAFIVRANELIDRQR